MWWLVIPAVGFIGAWLYGAKLVATNAPPLPHDVPPPTPPVTPPFVPGTPFVPGVLPGPQPSPPAPLNLQSPFQVGDFVLVDLTQLPNDQNSGLLLAAIGISLPQGASLPTSLRGQVEPRSLDVASNMTKITVDDNRFPPPITGGHIPVPTNLLTKTT